MFSFFLSLSCSSASVELMTAGTKKLRHSGPRNTKIKVPRYLLRTVGDLILSANLKSGSKSPPRKNVCERGGRTFGTVPIRMELLRLELWRRGAGGQLGGKRFHGFTATIIGTLQDKSLV